MIEPVSVPILLDLELEEEELDLSIEEAEEYAAQIGSLITISKVYGGLPSGGNAGEILIKNSDEDYDAIWGIIKNGANIWWTSHSITQGETTIYTAKRYVIGRTDMQPEIHDFLVGRDIEVTEGTPNTLYEIIGINQLVYNLKRIGNIGENDYNKLLNKPQIDGIEINKDSTPASLGLATTSALEEKYTKPSGGIPASDLAEGVIPEVHNIPSGGSIGQALIKNSNEDYDANWSDIDSELPDVNNTDYGKVLTVSNDGIWNAQQPIFMVTITYKNNVFSANKTFSEITNAAEHNMMVVATYAGAYYQYCGIGGGTAVRQFVYIFTRNNIQTIKLFSVNINNVWTQYQYQLGTYSKPDSGIPASDLADDVNLVPAFNGTAKGNKFLRGNYPAMDYSWEQVNDISWHDASVDANDDIVITSGANNLAKAIDKDVRLALRHPGIHLTLYDGTIVSLLLTYFDRGSAYRFTAVAADTLYKIGVTKKPNQANFIVTYSHNGLTPFGIGAVAAPAKPQANQVLRYNGSIWDAKTLTASDVGAYEKPATGIPKTDMAEDVQTSLGKANTALQQHQSLAAYRTSQAQDEIDRQQNTAIAAKYTKPSSGIPASDLEDGVIPTVPTNVSAFKNDMGYLTEADRVEIARGAAAIVEDAVSYDANALALWTKGGIASASGEYTASETRLRSGYVPDNVREIIPAAGYKYIVAAYDGGAYVGMWDGEQYAKSATWHTGPITTAALGDYDYRLVLSTLDNASIGTDSFDRVTLRAATDETLTRSGVPADAAATAAMCQSAGGGFRHVKSANLFDPDAAQIGYVFKREDGSLGPAQTMCSQYIPFAGSGTYVMLFPANYYGMSGIYVYLFDRYKTPIARIHATLLTDPNSPVEQPARITVPELPDAAYIGYSCNRVSLSRAMMVKAADYPAEYIAYEDYYELPALKLTKAQRQDSFSGDYDDLTNQPQINSVTLSGNKTATDLGLLGEDDIATDEEVTTMLNTIFD